MTLPSVSTSTPKLRRHDSGGYEEGNVVISRILLMLACVWPLFVLGWLGTSSSSSGTITTTSPNQQHYFPEVTTDWKNPGLSFRKYLDRVDIMGYGPTHPRVAVVLVGDDDDKNNKNNHSDILRSIESVLKYTDRNRLFLICVVLDGIQSNIQEFTNEAKALPQRIWQQQDKDDEIEPKKSHGLRYEERQQQQQQSNKYLAKIHILSSTQKQGIAASRADAIEFISMLSTKHEQAGIKSPEEDLMLLLLQPGSELISHEWLSHVTSALIVPPPLWGNAVEDVTVALQLANAVSFGVVQPQQQQQGKQIPSSATMSFDTLLRSQWMSANAKDMALSNGYSYPTPALAGAATALRLQTYLHLPAQDTSLSNEWAANLELSLNLWLCADGIDVLSPVMVNRSVSASSSSQDLSSQILEPKDMARFAAAWMDISSSQQVFQALSSTDDSRLPKLSRSDWENMMLTAKRHRQFPTGLPGKCRSWKWFVQTFNPLFELPKNDNTVTKEVSKPNDTVVVHQQQQITPQKEDPVIQNVVKKETTKPIPKVVQQQPTPPPKKEDPVIPQVAQKETIKPISIVAQKQSTPPPTPKKEVDPIIPKVVKQETEKPIPIVAQPQNTPPTQPKKDPETPQVITQETIKPIPAAVQQQQVNSPPVPAVIKENTVKLLPDETRRKPIRPLDPKRLEIIQKAPAVNITFVSMMKEPTMDFPHKGARDENGKWGYVHDETALRKNPPIFHYPQLKEACDKRDNHYNMLTEQVFVDFEADQEAAKSGKPRAKIFCLVYTIESGHDRIPFIQETWGPRCDGFMVGSNKTDTTVNAVDIPHEGPEEYDNIWQKVRSMWSYIYDNYYEKYDWFHIGGDDLYLIVDNLRLYLESEEIQTALNGGIYLPNGDETTQTPLFLGRRFQYLGDPNDIFNSGGSGYTMNKAALKLLVVEGFPNYFPHMHTFSEDTMVARIFRKFGVYPYDTKDENGGERYNPFQPGHHWGYRPPADISKDWYAKYSIDVKWGKEHCAKRSVAFHYVKKDTQKRFHAILYKLCPK